MSKKFANRNKNWYNNCLTKQYACLGRVYSQQNANACWVFIGLKSFRSNFHISIKHFENLDISKFCKPYNTWINIITLMSHNFIYNYSNIDVKTKLPNRIIQSFILHNNNKAIHLYYKLFKSEKANLFSNLNDHKHKNPSKVVPNGGGTLLDFQIFINYILLTLLACDNHIPAFALEHIKRN